MVSRDIFKIAKLEVLINKISKYYENDKIEIAMEKFNQRLVERAEKLNLDELDICYSMTFIYQETKYDEWEKIEFESSSQKVDTIENKEEDALL